MNNLLSNSVGLNTGIGVVGGYNQPQKNIRQVINDNIITSVKSL